VEHESRVKKELKLFKRNPEAFMEQMNWDSATQEKFYKLIERIPVFLRGIAEEKVSQKAESIIKKEGRGQVTEKDLVDAFFAETPFGFHGPMKNDMTEVGIDYTKYGYDK
jgi:hypothetical protein